jgi:mono/diheme cytochrome c family protein
LAITRRSDAILRCAESDEVSSSKVMNAGVGRLRFPPGYAESAEKSRSGNEADMQRRSRIVMVPLALAALLGLGILSPMSVSASDLGANGAALAAEHCSPCHAVGATDQSPHKITPPLRSLAADYPIPMLVEALKTGIISGHDEMPMFDLGVDGVKALVAYIDGLNPDGPKYLGKKP